MCYDFDGLSLTSTELSIRWTLAGGGHQFVKVTVTKDSPCADVPVPANAGAVLIQDGSGHSADYAGAVS